MRESISKLGSEELEHQARFLNALARSLVRDPHESEDLTQETWLRALERPPRGTLMQRAWLRKVLTNFARQSHRSRERRSARERSAACSDQLPSHERVVERMELNRRLMTAVVELPEPYRTTVHLRYFEDLPVREIARRSDLPFETVKSRLKRGLDQLRERLDDEFGGRREHWQAALLPLISGGAKALPLAGGATTLFTSLGVLSMSIALKSMLLLSALAAGWFLFWPPAPGTAESSFTPSSVAPAVPPTAQASKAPDRALAPQETVADADPAEPDPVSATALPVTGRVTVRDGEGRFHTEESGHFRLISATLLEKHWYDIEVEGGQWTARIEPGLRIGIQDLTMGGRYCRLPSPVYNFPAEGRLDLEGTWQPASSLRVFDRRSRVELDHVEVKLRTAWRAIGVDLHPGDHENVVVVASDAESPIELPPNERVKIYWARTAGSAWQRVEVDHDTGGEHQVWLDPGAALTVSLTSSGLEEPLYLHLRSSGQAVHEHVVEVRAGQAPEQLIEALPPGKYRLSADVGFFTDCKELAGTEVELYAGRTTQAQLTVDGRWLNQDKVMLSGTLRVPLELRDSRFGLRLSLASGAGQAPVELRREMLQPDPSDPVYSKRAAEAAAGR